MRVAVHGVLLLLWLLSSSVFAFHAQVNDLADKPFERQSLQQVYFQIIPAAKTIDDLLADPLYHHSFELLTPAQRLLFSEHQAVWLFARLKNSGNRPLHTVLEYDFPLADKIEIYQVDREHQDVRLLSRTGNDYPFSERALPYRSFAASIKLAPDEEADIFFKIQDAAVIPSELRLWQTDHFSAAKQRQAMLDGLLQGFLLLLALYNLILLAQTRARHYLYFAGFFVSFALTIAVLNGMAFALLWPGYPEINQAILYIVVGFNLLCLNLFVRYAVQTLSGSWWHLSNHISNFVALLLLFSPLFAGGQLRLYLLFFAIAWVLGSNLLLAFRLSLQGHPQARSFVWACVFILICALLLTLSQAGYLHADFNWSYILFSLVLLCLALTSFNLHKFQLKPVASSATLAELQNYHDIFHNAVEGMFITTIDGRLLTANTALLHILGYQNEEQLKQAIAGDGMARFYADPGQYQHVLQQLELGSRKRFEIHGLRADNSPFWALMSVRLAASDNQRPAFVHGSVIDITEQKLAHQQLAYLANHDALTGLANRQMFLMQLRQRFSYRNREANPRFALLFIDLDRFKLINDTLGHHIGDLFLIEVSQRLQQTVREHDLVARLGGDEFVLAATDTTAEGLLHLAERVQQQFKQQMQQSGLESSLSIGIASSVESPLDQLLQRADQALYKAKELGRDRVEIAG